MKIMNSFSRVWPALALALCFAGGCDAPAGSAAEQSALTEPARRDPNPAIYEKDARPFGLGMERWSEEWWRWAYSMPAASNPNTQLTADCDQNQEGPVFFLPGYFAGGASVTRSCAVPRHKAIAVSLASLLNDYPCPDPTFKPAPGQSLFNFLIDGANQAQQAEVATVAASLDGKAFADLNGYHYASDDLFYFKADSSLQSVDGCITGARQPAVAASYFIVLKALEPGRHVLTTSMVSPSGSVEAATINLDVR